MARVGALMDPNLDVVVAVTGICRLSLRIVLSFERSSWTQKMLPRVPTKGTQVAPPALGGVAKRLRSGRQIRLRKRLAPAAPVENLAGRSEIEEQLFQRPLVRFIRVPARGAWGDAPVDRHSALSGIRQVRRDRRMEAAFNPNRISVATATGRSHGPKKCLRK